MKKTFASLFTLLLFVILSKAQGYQIGQVVEDFKLKNINGKMVSLSDYKDANGYIIVFTCNHCPYAKMYEKRLIDLHKTFNKKGFPVIAINPNDPELVPEDSYEEMQKISKKKKYPFAYLLDETQSVYPKFGATKTPHVFILDKNKAVKYIGAIDDNAKDESGVKIKYAENAISAISKGQNPDPAITKAIGCSIKKKS